VASNDTNSSFVPFACLFPIPIPFRHGPVASTTKLPTMSDMEKRAPRWQEHQRKQRTDHQ
jgi:hypothetical protein